MAAAPAPIWILCALFTSVVLAAAAAWLVLQPPWLGLQLQPEGAGVRIVATKGPAAAALPADAVGARLHAIGRDGLSPVALQAHDLVEDPDHLPTHRAIRDLYAHQGELMSVLQGPGVVLAWGPAGERPREALIATGTRPLADLPPVFWLQLAVSAVALVAAVWVRQQRPHTDSTAWFLLLGVMLALASWSSAVYGSRELALPPATFRFLSLVNSLSVFTFGVALIALFLRFPRPLCRPRQLAWVAAAVAPFALGDSLQWIDSLDVSRRAPMAAMLVAAMAACALQWRASRSDPGARSTLRWFAISVLGGCFLFISLVTLPPLFGAGIVLSQGHAFGFFLLIHVGLALGVARSQLFDIDVLSARVLLWALAGGLLLVLDAALLLLLRTGPGLSLATSALLVAAAWQPLRSWLLARFVARRRLPEHEMLQGALEVALAATPPEREARWRLLLERMFQPLRTEPLAGAAQRVELAPDGLSLVVPAAPRLGALRLSYPWRGRGVFQAADARTLDRLLALLHRAELDREAYERGVRETSLRIAQDLHDDLSGRLLSVLYESDPAQAHRTVRTVIADMRNIVGALSGRAPDWDDAVAEWRSEAAQRMSAAGIGLEWPLQEQQAAQLGPEAYRHLSSILRELVTNVIRHSGARTVNVEARHEGSRVWLRFADDGVGLQAPAGREGQGLENIARRAAALGARHRWVRGPGTALELELPLQVGPVDATAQPRAGAQA